MALHGGYLHAMRVMLRSVLRSAAWCCVVLRGAAWCCVMLRGVLR